MAKRYYEVEFGVWVEEPDPMRKPACDAVWTGDWDHGYGPRPRCFRPEGHSDEHHETRPLTGADGMVEYFWGEDAASARTELRHEEPSPEGGGPEDDPQDGARRSEEERG